VGRRPRPALLRGRRSRPLQNHRGGQTWKTSLTITPDTGVTDFDIDPRNPDIMYAAAYQRRRHTSIIIAGGPDIRHL
jgi:hypothetical protein